jgi:type I restriction enzyme S subunit
LIRITTSGEIPKDWETVKLSDYLIIKGRIGWKGLKRSEFNSNDDYIIVNGPDIKEGKVNWENCMKIPTSRYNESPEIMLKVNDILMTKDGTIGKLAFIDRLPAPATVASGIFVIRSKSKDLNIKYLYYVFKSPYFKNLIISRTEGSVIPHLYQRDIEQLLISKPPLKEQDIITKILYGLDSKIELNNRMNETLDVIVQRIFKEWFLNFEFPNEKGRPYKSSNGKLIESELGKIPKGWEVRRLGDFIKVERGLSYKGSGLSNVGLPLINLGTMAPNGGFTYRGLKFYSGEFKERNLVKAGDIVIANTDITQNREVLGSPAIVPFDLGTDKILFTHHIYALRNSSVLPNLFIYYLLQSKKYKDRTRGFATGTTVLSLPEDAILNLSFILPEKNVIKKFEKLSNEIRSKITNNINESRDLTNIIGLLLPKLISGKIRVTGVSE